MRVQQACQVSACAENVVQGKAKCGLKRSIAIPVPRSFGSVETNSYENKELLEYRAGGT